MNYQALITTIVSGVIGIALLVCTTVLLVVGEAVPEQFIPAMLMAFGVAVGATKAGQA